MATVLGANSVTGGYDVENSLRFNFGSSDYLNLTAAGNSTLSTKGTWSTWIKKSNPGSSRGPLFSGYADASNRVYMVINADAITVFGKVGGTVRYTAQVDQFNRDTSAWMNIVVAIDTTQGTAANRIKIYINGTAATIGDTNTPVYPVQDTAIPYAATSSYTNLVGALYSTSLSQYLDGYLAETVFVDGLALDQNSFGEFDSDSGIWKPIKVSGLTFGDNGFYLEFKQAGTSANASGLGADTSGNTSHFTVNNLTAVDQSTDTCTNNFATWNPLDNFYQSNTYSEANLQVQTQSTSFTYNSATIGVSTGKWYWEVEYDAKSGGTDQPMIGITSTQPTANDNELGNFPNDFAWYTDNGTGYLSNDNTYSDESFSAYTVGNVISVALDLDNNKLYFAKNGTWEKSGNPESGSTGTGAISITSTASTPLGAYFPSVGDATNSQNATFKTNFGSPPYAISSSNADGNGFGNFEYAVPSGYFSLNTKNLAENG